MQDLTRGPVLRCVAGLAGFMLAGMVVQTLYSLVDLYWVGSLGAPAQAAVTISANVTLISIALTSMISGGATALVAQAIGAKDAGRADRVFNQAIGLSLIVMVLFAGLGWSLEVAYAQAFAADAETAGLTTGYLRWFVPSMALQFPIGTAFAALRGAGSIRPAMLLQIGGVVLNIVLAPLLIFGWLGLPALGVAGAGLATFVAASAGAVAALYFLVWRCRFLHLRPAMLLPRPALSWTIMKIGLPSTVEYALLTIYLVFVISILRPFGAVEQAAFGISQRVTQACMMPAIAFSFASAAVAGQNYGAGLPRRVRETFVACLKLSLSVAVPVFVLLELIPSVLVGIFSSDPEVVATGAEIVQVFSISLVALAVNTSCFGVLSGLGNTIPTLISSAVRVALIIGPIGWVSTWPSFHPIWIWELSIAAQVVQTLLNLYFLRRVLDRRLQPIAAAVAAAAE